MSPYGGLLFVSQVRYFCQVFSFVPGLAVIHAVYRRQNLHAAGLRLRFVRLYRGALALLFATKFLPVLLTVYPHHVPGLYSLHSGGFWCLVAMLSFFALWRPCMRHAGGVALCWVVAHAVSVAYGTVAGCGGTGPP